MMIKKLDSNPFLDYPNEMSKERNKINEVIEVVNKLIELHSKHFGVLKELKKVLVNND